MDSTSWLPLSLLATLLFGISAAFYKLPSKNGYGKIATTFWLMAGATLLSVVFFHSHLGSLDPRTLILSMLWGISFATMIMLQMYALSKMETNALFPVTTTLSLVLTVGVGLVIFAERLSELQIIGVLLAIVSIYFFAHQRGRVRFSHPILFVGASIALTSSLGKIVQKIAADGVNIFTFQIYQYTFAAVFVLAVYLIANRGNYKDLFSRAMPWGLLNSTLSFFGGWAILVALTRGPFTLITSIHSTYILVTALIGWLFLDENLNAKKTFLICLAIVAVVLMRMG